MDSLASEKETLREQLATLKRRLKNVKEESLDQGHKLEELKSKSVAELATVRPDAKAIIYSYRADTKAANAREKENPSVAKVKLSSALDHARRPSRRETIKEVHARDFDLSSNTERANTLVEEDAAFLFDDDDSASGSRRCDS